MSGKIYLENPYLKDLRGKVIKKEKKDNKYHVILNRTIFYPRNSESVNIDKGVIDRAEVIDVFEEKGQIIHVVEGNISSKEINMQIDWNIRFDYMQQHTGQHILSASINKLCGANTLKFHFDENYSYISIDLKDLNTSDINRIERFANHMIYSNFQIKSSMKQEESKTTRLISIDSISTIPCEGIHCSSTGEVGIIKIINFKKNEEDSIDVKFVCGNRALKDYTFKNTTIKKVTEILSVEQIDLCEKIEDILETNNKLKEELEILKSTKASIYNKTHE